MENKMNVFVALAVFVVGLGLVVYFAEKLVKGVVGTSLGFGVSTFLISVVFIGFDPENLAVGAVAAYNGVAGIALGSIIGAAMVAIALAFGITALIAPMKFEQAPGQVLAVPILSVILFGGLALDGQLSRADGAILLAGFALALLFLLWLSRRGLDIKATGEVAETLKEAEPVNRWKSAGLLAVSLAAIIVSSELLVAGAETILAQIGLSDTVFGMTALALLVSIEELARELPAARQGKAEISIGNVAGSILAFFLFNAGIVALVSPVAVSNQVLSFYLPLCLGTVIVVSLFMLARRVPRWAGGVLVALYLAFAVGGYMLG
jgi:cation:H+ antiporter